MADEGYVEIKDLDGASAVVLGDEIIVQQNENTKRASLELIGKLLVYIKSIIQTHTSEGPSGVNEITVTLSNGHEETFRIRNGSSIQTIRTVTESHESNGKNVIRVETTDGREYDFSVFNGSSGEKGEKGDTGATGESGIQVPTKGLFTLSVDAEGDLWCSYADQGEPPQFELEEDGSIYYITD